MAEEQFRALLVHLRIIIAILGFIVGIVLDRAVVAMIPAAFLHPPPWARCLFIYPETSLYTL